MGKIFIIVFLAQTVTITVILFILRIKLDKQLTESAIHSVETMRPDSMDSSLSSIEVVTYNQVSEFDQKRIVDAVFKRIHQTVKLSIKQDKAIKGGMIIRLKDKIIDCSLHSRLKDSGMLR